MSHKNINKTTAISSAEANIVREAPPDASNTTNTEGPQASTSSNHLEGNDGAVASSTVHEKQLPPPKLTKKQQRIARKAQRAAAKTAPASLDDQSISVPGAAAPTALDLAPTISANVPPSVSMSVTPSRVGNATETRDPSLDLPAGFWTEIVRLE